MENTWQNRVFTSESNLQLPSGSQFLGCLVLPLPLSRPAVPLSKLFPTAILPPLEENISIAWLPLEECWPAVPCRHWRIRQHSLYRQPSVSPSSAVLRPHLCQQVKKEAFSNSVFCWFRTFVTDECLSEHVCNCAGVACTQRHSVHACSPPACSLGLQVGTAPWCWPYVLSKNLRCHPFSFRLLAAHHDSLLACIPAGRIVPMCSICTVGA